MLTINNITKTFNLSTPDERKALDDFSLSVKPGEFVTLIGANGAGKSTLFNAICGNFITDSGSIILDGHDITLMPQYERSRNIGRLYQDPTLGTAPGMTIEENLALATKTGRWITHITNRDRELFGRNCPVCRCTWKTDSLSRSVHCLADRDRPWRC